jgi:endonuclease III
MPTKLQRVVQLLRKQHGPVEPPPPTNAFEHILWEKVAYLATDDRRARAFDALRSQVGLTPEAILAARPAVLRKIAAMGGGVAVDDRVGHMQDAAALVIDEFGGTLDRAAHDELRDAVKALRRFHGIGEPGAERILLLTRAHKLLPLDSNGARVMVRLGYGREDKNYGAMYRSVRQAAAPELTQTFDWLTDAHLLLRRHGQEVCKTSKPRCSECLARPECQFAGGRTKPLR